MGTGAGETGYGNRGRGLKMPGNPGGLGTGPGPGRTLEAVNKDMNNACFVKHISKAVSYLTIPSLNRFKCHNMANNKYGLPAHIIEKKLRGSKIKR